MISRIVQDEVYVIHRSRRLRWIAQTEALMILNIMRKPNSVFVLLGIQIKKKTKKNSNVGYVIGYTNGAHENFNENIIRNNFFKCSLDASMFLR